MLLSMYPKDGQTPVNTITIVVNADSPEDFGTIMTRNKVLAFARQNGLPTASGLGNIPAHYPVDENGICDEDLMLARRPFKHFQAEYTVNAGLGL